MVVVEVVVAASDGNSDKCDGPEMEMGEGGGGGGGRGIQAAAAREARGRRSGAVA